MTGHRERKAVGTLRVPVTAVEPLVRQYARLGLRIVEQSGREAVIELPCGILLVLSETRALRRAPAA